MRKKIIVLLCITFTIGLLLMPRIYVQGVAPTFRCYGYVRDNNFNGLSGATVKLIDPDGIVRASTTSTSSGYYSVSCYTADYALYTVQASKSGYITKSYYQYSSGTHRIDFILLSSRTCRVTGTVYKDDTPLPLIGASIKLYSPSGLLLDSETADLSGYFDVSGTVYELGSFKLTVSKTGYETQTKYYSDATYYSQSFYMMYPDTTSNKFAFFFYDSTVNFMNCVQTYAAVIELEGFEATTYADENEWRTQLWNIDVIEGPSDYVFLYFYGHGNYFEETSYINVGASDYIYSSVLNGFINKFESNNIFIVVESCRSGGFVTDLQAPDRFIISSTHLEGVALGHTLIGPFFSNNFFCGILLGMSDIGAFNYAHEFVFIPFVQMPMYNDQLPYTWFSEW